MSDSLWTMTACQVADALSAGELVPADLLAALEARIARVDPAVNALPTLCMDRARAVLERNGDRIAAAPLHGLPVPIKDSYRVEGVRTTWGSLVFDDHVAERSDYAVEAIERAGGLVYAKTNTPEFEAGANTFNEVFGATLNPWDTNRSAAGSSGGAAVAVATGMAFIAQGSDFACSLRYPAAFCGVVGLRPTPGLVPQGPSAMPYQALSVTGPLARSVADTGLALDAMAAFEPGDPLTAPHTPAHYRRSAERPTRPARAAYSETLGLATVSTPVREVVGAAIGAAEREGCAIVRADPDLADAHPVFRTLRAFQFAVSYAHVLQNHRERLKPEVAWNIEQGLELTSMDLATAERGRAMLRQSMLDFLDRYGLLVAPTAPVAPGPVTERFVAHIEGIEMVSYLDWLVLGYAISVTGCPAISVPCGFTSAGLPVGLQIVAPPHAEAELLQSAAWFEEVLSARLDKPIDPVAVPSGPQTDVTRGGGHSC